MPTVDIAQYPDTLEAFSGNAQRSTVFLDRYAMKDRDGKPIERTPGEMWLRVAKAIGNSELERERVYNLLRGFKFVPGGRILAGAGVDALVTYYNCYVIPVETKVRRAYRSTDPIQSVPDPGNDSREAIFDTIGLMVDIMSRGGGVGINWSVLRPKGAYLKSVNGTSSGPVGWMDVASKAVGEVEQGGSRRGAAMFMLDDWHPDVLDFIDAKRDLTRITNANISVAVSDAFMQAVKENDYWEFRFPDTADPHYNSEWDGDLQAWESKGYPVIAYGKVAAREVWRKLAEAAWDNGEPGVVFLDRYNKLSTAQGVERIISVNPCGEQGLGPYSVCNLGAMNLDAYVVPKSYEKTVRRDGSVEETWNEYPYFKWDEFRADVREAVRFLDRVVDENYYFIPENEAIQMKLRRIGLGVMGLADALIGLGYRYGSAEAVEFTEAVFREMKYAAVEASSDLASMFGPAPGWDPSMLDRPYLRDLPGHLRDKVEKHGLRNLFLLTQAPTGTTSILAGVNSGIEPYFAFGYWRNDRTGKHWVAAPAVDKYGPKGAPDLPDEFVASNDVTVEEHIAMQAAVQMYVDSSVSKTINAPNSHTVEDVEKAYTFAYESGLKGLAYFRDGCGRAQVLSRDGGSDGTKQLLNEVQQENEALREQLDRVLGDLMDYAIRFDRPPVLTGKTARLDTEVGTAYVTVNFMQSGRPVEMFVTVGKAGTDIMELGEAIGRLGSLALQNHATLHDVAKQLEGIGGTSRFVHSLPDAIGSALRQMADENVATPYFGPPAVGAVETKPVKSFAAPKSHAPAGQMCPDCKNFSVVIEEGCKKCHLCGWSAC